MLQIAVICMLAVMMLWSGLQCRFGDIRVLADIGFTIRAFVFSAVLVPLLALGFSRLLGILPEHEGGLMLMAVSGGVPFLPLTTSTARGEVRAAVSLVFLLALISVVTAPITMGLLTGQFDIHAFPVVNFIGKLLLIQFVPLLIGTAIASRATPQLTAVLVRIFLLLTFVSVLVVLVMLGQRVAESFISLFATRTILTIALTIAASMVVAWLLGGKDLGKRTVLTDATGLRNPGLALLLAGATLPGPVSVSAVLVYLIVQIFAGAIAGVLMRRVSIAANAPA